MEVPPPYAAHWGGPKISGGAGAILQEPATEWESSGAAIVADSFLLPTVRSAGLIRPSALKARVVSYLVLGSAWPT